MTAVVQTASLTAAYGDRVLFADLSMSLEREKVALVGSNGMGKSTLLALLAGETSPRRGTVTRLGGVVLVPQRVPDGPGSPGQRRLQALHSAFASEADLLLLDEPTQDLDEDAVDWLLREVSRWGGGLLVASHDRRLLEKFAHFFVMAESGCRYLAGRFEDLEAGLERDFRSEEERYLRRLNQLEKDEEHTLQSARRRRRKEQYGRVREIDRATSSLTLNMKRNQAQVNHGRINRLREQRLEESRAWARSARRSLKVELSLEVDMPVLPPCSGPVIQASAVSASVEGRLLFGGLELRLARERVALTGPNGAGKTTLLRVLTGERRPDSGSVRVDVSRLGVIEQGGVNWMLEESLVEILERFLPADSVGRCLVASRFPLALASRPLRTLSPGERVRAALLALLTQRPVAELLVLDEPTYSLDLLGQSALIDLLRAWPGGLLVASHNRQFLKAIGVERTLRLGE